MYSNVEVIKLAKSWLGKKENDGTYKEIIDTYNSFSPLPRKLKMQYGWAWCACTWSALAIKLGYTEIMPIEISCGNLVEAAKKMNIWVENDGYIPKPGDAVLYDWDDSGKGDNIGWPDHVGIVEYVNTKSGYFVVIEGNYNNQVKQRTVSINGKYIRGFITPQYDSVSYDDPCFSTQKSIREIALEVIVGKWGYGTERKVFLKNAGFSYEEVQNEVNRILNTPNAKPQVEHEKKVVVATCKAAAFEPDYKKGKQMTTTDNLYCRNDAGTNKKALCKIPKGTKVTWYGYYTTVDMVRWFLVQVEVDGVQYTGFCSSKYLK